MSSIPSGWKACQVGDYLNIGRGFAFKSHDYRMSGLPIVRVTNITNSGDIDLTNNVVFLDKNEITKYSNFILRPDDVLIVMVGATVGKLAKIRQNIEVAVLNQNMWRLVILDKKNDFQKYTYYAIQPVVDKFLSSQQGSARDFLTQSGFSLADIVLPPLPEQQKIAAILTSVDDVIESTKAQINKLKDLKTGMLQELLTKGIGHSEFKDSPVGRIPKAWDVVKLQSCINNIYSGWSPVCDSRVRTGDEWGILKTTAVVWSGYAPNENKVLADHHEFVENAIVRRSDILITRKGPRERVGVCVYVNDTPDRLMVPDTVFRLIVGNSSSLSAEFISVALSSEAVQLDWNRKKVGLAEAQVNINHQTFNSTYIVAPSKDEQNKICSALKEIQKYINDKQEKFNIYSSLKKALMQDLLTGKVRVKVN